MQIIIKKINTAIGTIREKYLYNSNNNQLTYPWMSNIPFGLFGIRSNFDEVYTLLVADEYGSWSDRLSLINRPRRSVQVNNAD